MELLGKNLESVFHRNKFNFSLKTVCMIGIQIITGMEHLHKRHIVHRDIKAENILLGSGDRQHIVYIIDFGLSKQYRDPVTLKHAKYRRKKNFTGNNFFASCNAMLGYGKIILYMFI